MRKRDQVVLLGLLASMGGALWLAPDLDAAMDKGSVAKLVVRTALDDGPSSLRDAIFQALRHDGPAAITIEVQTVVLAAPLPPLAGADGISISAKPGYGQIDSSAVRAGPVLDLRAGEVTLVGIGIRSAPAAAIRIAGATNVVLDDVALSGGDVGVAAGSGYRLTVLGGELAENRVGIELNGDGVALISRKTLFRDQTDAAVWAVRPDEPGPGATLELTDGRIEGGRYGVVLGNVTARLHGNTLSDFKADGVLAFGGELDAASNRIERGAVGIRAVGSTSATIASNEIDDNGAIGILLQGSWQARVESNRLYRNGYGIATVLSANSAAVEVRNNLLVSHKGDGLVVIGDSPLLSDNRALQNHQAGIRIMNVVRPDSVLEASPRLVGNELRSNGSDTPVRAEYVLQPTSAVTR